MEVILLGWSNIYIAFPAKIGCGMGHGDWNQYYAAIQALAMRKPTWSINIYEWTLPRLDNQPTIDGKYSVVDPALCSESCEKPVGNADKSSSLLRSCLKKAGPLVAENDASTIEINTIPSTNLEKK